MKKSIQAKKHHGSRPAAAKPGALPQSRSSLKLWVVLGFCLVSAGGATWAFMEFVVWNNLPGELVGTWEVVQGPPEYKEAVFEFYRSGKMIGRLDFNDRIEIMKAEVRVEGDKLYITTRHPTTNEKRLSVQTIRTLNDKELVVADERGKIIKMVRMNRVKTELAD